MARETFISFVDSVSSFYGIGIGKGRREEELTVNLHVYVCGNMYYATSLSTYN